MSRIQIRKGYFECASLFERNVALSLPSVQSSLKEISERLFLLLSEYSVLGSATNKESVLALNQLLRKSFTQLIVMADNPFLTDKHVSLLLSYVEIDVLDANRQATAFALIKALVRKKVEHSQIAEVMKKQRELSITSSYPHIRTHCREEMKVNWAVEPGQQQPKVDTSKHFHVFVGDLSPEVDNKALKEAFAPFGDVSDAKVIRDVTTLKSKGYGFVSYPKREEAERAIEQMNGQWLGRRTIRTNWATRKPGQGGGDQPASSEKTYEDIFNMTTPDNTSVYVGNVAGGVCEEDIREAFGQFGRILEVRIFKVQGYAFVKFDSKDCACRAILRMNGGDLGGNTIRCSWGKTSDSEKRQQGYSNYGQGAYGYGGQATGSSGYGPPATGGPGGAAAAAAAQAQQQYYNYYAQYYSNPQVMQQWANYWQQQQGGAGQPGTGAANGNR